MVSLIGGMTGLSPLLINTLMTNCGIPSFKLVRLDIYKSSVNYSAIFVATISIDSSWRTLTGFDWIFFFAIYRRSACKHVLLFEGLIAFSHL